MISEDWFQITILNVEYSKKGKTNLELSIFHAGDIWQLQPALAIIQKTKVAQRINNKQTNKPNTFLEVAVI